jgi:filamentous hemagglutinin
VIEGKASQGNSVLTQTSLPDVQIQEIANRVFGKPTARNIDVLFFQRPDGSIVRINRIGG